MSSKSSKTLQKSNSNEINLDTANKMIKKALLYATKNALPPMGVVVLDSGGNLKAFQRQDGASMFRFDIARGKAWASIAMGVSSRKLATESFSNPVFFTNLSSTSHGKFLPQPGALVIKNKHGRIIGAIGVSGGTGDQDEFVAAEGIRSFLPL
jgi:uncharacterized protein GlcG (DUF336 family)